MQERERHGRGDEAVSSALAPLPLPVVREANGTDPEAARVSRYGVVRSEFYATLLAEPGTGSLFFQEAHHRSHRLFRMRDEALIAQLEDSIVRSKRSHHRLSG